ncbi:MAG: aldo/keto reductase [Nocardioides sp.]
MQTRTLGNDGPGLSVLGLGCNNFGMKLDVDETRAVVGAALDAGINHFDTAEMYGGGRSEEYLAASLGSLRDEAVIATKYSPRPVDEPYLPGVLAKRIREGCEGSLRRLRTDRIDVLYQHHPDPDAPFDEVMETLDELVRAGKVLTVAMSNLDAAQIDAVTSLARERGLAGVAGVQLEWSLLARQAEETIVPAARSRSLGIVPYFPLASGLLTGKYSADGPHPAGSRLAEIPLFAEVATAENFAKVDRLASIAAESGRSMVSLALAWLLAQDGVTSVIAGATSPSQVATNVESLDWVLDAADLQAVDEALSPGGDG